MAEALLHHLCGARVEVQSCGVMAGEPNGFALATMNEIGIDLTRHCPKSFEEIGGQPLDWIISLTPEAQHKAVDMAHDMSAEVLYWPILDPLLVHGHRDQILEAFRNTRETLRRRIVDVFGLKPAPNA
jgi:protein-tyrosine-phosphatase